MQNKSFMFFS